MNRYGSRFQTHIFLFTVAVLRYARGQPQNKMHRREFLRRTAAAIGAASLTSFPHHLFATAAVKQASDTLKLGPMGVPVTRMAMGTGTMGSNGTSAQTRQLGLMGLANLLKLGYDNGVTFWDSADQYGSHPHLREALKTIPREKVTILSKTHAATAPQMRADLDRFRRELGTDYIDIMLLHCVTDPDWPTTHQGAMDVISEAREKGIIRTHGVSCHSLGALKTAAATDWVQVDLARINPTGASMDADAKTVLAVLREMKAKGKGIIGMKLLGQGALVDHADECFQWNLAQDCVDCFTLGMENAGQLQSSLKQIPAASVRG